MSENGVLLVTAIAREAAGIAHGAVALGTGVRAGEALQALLRSSAQTRL